MLEGAWMLEASKKCTNMFHTSGPGWKHVLTANSPWTNPRSTDSTASASWCFPDATSSHQTFYQVANHTFTFWRSEDLASTKVWRIWRFRSWNPCDSDTSAWPHDLQGRKRFGLQMGFHHLTPLLLVVKKPVVLLNVYLISTMDWLHISTKRTLFTLHPVGSSFDLRHRIGNQSTPREFLFNGRTDGL